MPKIDYQNKTRIYKITSPQTSDMYIGVFSGADTLDDRLVVHKNAYVRFMDGTDSYCSSFPIIIFDDCKIELVEHYKCINKTQMNKRWIFWKIAYSTSIND